MGSAGCLPAVIVAVMEVFFCVFVWLNYTQEGRVGCGWSVNFSKTLSADEISRWWLGVRG